MATTSTLPAFHARFVTIAKGALATAGRDGGQVSVYHAWPGTVLMGVDEAVFGGSWPDRQGPPLVTTDVTSEIPTLKAGRKQRQENYDFDFTVWVFRPDANPGNPEVAQTRAYDILDDLEDEFADDPQIGLASIQHAVIRDIRQTLWPFETGWSCVLETTVEVDARLT